VAKLDPWSLGDAVQLVASRTGTHTVELRNPRTTRANYRLSVAEQVPTEASLRGETIVPLMFGTDRALTGSNDQNRYFATKEYGRFRYGTGNQA
jgi:hypothetical protein